MTESQRKREYLDWWKEEGDVSDMEACYPFCACENAAAAPDGFGPILDEERLRYFVVSRSDIDLKGGQKKITSSIFKRCFKKGVSTSRLAHADRSELNRSAQILHDIQVKNCGAHGGVLGVVDFEAGIVRRPLGTEAQVFCVFDTPLENRCAHADIVSSSAGLGPDIQAGLRMQLFNAIGGAAAFVPSEEVQDCDLTQFKPEAM